MKKSSLNKAIVVALGITATQAQAVTITYSWSGMVSLLDSSGVALANTSIPSKGNNQYQTPTTGTLSFDTTTGAGTGTIAPFDFFSGTSPMEATSMVMQAVGNGFGGPGTLVLVNMLYNWDGNIGMPVSYMADAEGMFGGTAVAPASDGTYVGSSVPGTGIGPGGSFGYLAQGPVPFATTAWNTTNTVACNAGCTGVTPSGMLPMIYDTASNPNDYTPNVGGGISGSPIQAGPFSGFSALASPLQTGILSSSSIESGGSSFNLDLVTMTVTGTTASTVPVPAGVWLFGSGLLGLLGVARRKA